MDWIDLDDGDAHAPEPMAPDYAISLLSNDLKPFGHGTIARAARSVFEVYELLSAQQISNILHSLSGRAAVHGPLLDRLDRRICDEPEIFDTSQHGTNLRAFANLRNNAVAFQQQAESFLQSDKVWGFNSLAKFLWAYAVLKSPLVETVGRDVLRRRGTSRLPLHPARAKDLWELSKLYGLEIPDDVDIRRKRELTEEEDPLEGSQSSFERHFASALRRAQVMFRQQVPVGWYTVDFAIITARGQLLVEIQGDWYHKTVDLTEQPPAPTGLLRGADLIRGRVLKELGRRVVFVSDRHVRDRAMSTVVDELIEGKWEDYGCEDL